MCMVLSKFKVVPKFIMSLGALASFNPIFVQLVKNNGTSWLNNVVEENLIEW